MDPALFKEFCDEFTREMNRLRIEGRTSIDAAQAELKRVDRELEKVMDLYLKDAMPIDMVKERSGKLDTRKKELQAFLEGAEEPPPLLHPNMAHHYRVQVDELYAALQEDSDAKRMAAAEMLRSLVREIVLTPEDGTLQIDVRGDLAGILAVSLKRKSPAVSRAGRSQVKMVAGTRADLHLRRSQFEMVAGAGFEPAAFRL